MAGNFTRTVAAGDLAGLLGTIAVAALFCWPQLAPGTSVPADFLSTVAPWDALVPGPPHNAVLGDPVLSVYPHRKFVNESLQRFQLPLWNPYILAGHPAMADPDVALFYPGTLLLAGLSAAAAFDAHVAVHVMLAAVGTYALLRLWGAGPLGAWLSAVTFCGSSSLVTFRLYGNPLAVAAWVPWLLAALEVGLRRTGAAPRRRRWIGMGAIVTGLMITANFLQWALYALLLVAAYAVFRSALAARRGEDWRAPLATAAAMVGTGLLVGAIQLVPSWELASLTPRIARMAYDRLSVTALPPAALLTVVAPDLFGTPTVPGSFWGVGNYAESTVYWGALPLVLALTAPWWRRSARVWFLWGALLFTASAAVGAPTLYLLGAMPGFDLFEPNRLTFLVCFLGAALAGLAAEPFVAGFRRAPFVVSIVVLLAAAAVLVSVWEWAPPSTPRPDGLNRAAWVLGGAFLVVGVAACPRRRMLAPSGLALLVLADVVPFALGYAPGPVPAAELFPPPRVLAPVPRDALVPVRVTGLDADDVVTLPNSLLTLGIADVAGYSSLVPRDNRELVNRINSYQNLDRNPLMPRIRNPASPLLDLAGVEYLLSRHPVPTTGWELVAADDSTFLHRNREVAPRAFVVGTVRVLNRKATWRALKAGDFHACQFATVLEGGPALPAAHRPGCVGEAQIVAYEPNRVAVRAEAWEDGLLVLTDSYHPGWRARVDGEERPVYSADGAFRGVWLTAGVHQVEFAFRPRSLMLGAFVSLAGLAAALMNIVARRT